MPAFYGGNDPVTLQIVADINFNDIVAEEKRRDRFRQMFEENRAKVRASRP